MKRYLYLSLTPESLISSMLPPEEFGTYMAVGTTKRSRGQAMFIEVDPEGMKGSLPTDYIERRCVPNSAGEPKRSVYLSIYRALESVPLKAMKSLYLATHDGRVLELQPKPYDAAAEPRGRLHLYQEICPVTPRIASSLAPAEFMKFMTDGSQQVSVPKLIVAEMVLNDLAVDPARGSDDDLPYPNLDHLRDCLLSLKKDPAKMKKTVLRNWHSALVYRMLTNGFFVGAPSEMIFYPYPTPAQMNDEHHVWWRSAISLLMSE